MSKQREIKFRAFHENENGIGGKMYNNSAFPTWNGCTEVWKNDEPQTETELIGPGPAMGEVYLMQFTGLHDKNGKEIYEGDIVKVMMEDVPYPYEIVWQHDRMRFGLRDTDGTDDPDSWAFTPQNDFEIIGNVHEHPELLTAP